MRWRMPSLIVAAALLAAPVHAQDHAPGYSAPRTSWGAPDLQGTWSNASITDMERDPGVDHLVLTPEEVALMEKADFFTTSAREEQNPVISAYDQRRLDGADLLSGGNYNAFWIEQGGKVATVRGQPRSSWVVDPADGRIPWLRPPEPPPGGHGEGGSSTRTLPLAAFVLSRSPVDTRRLTVAGPVAPDPLLGGRPESYANPETRPLSERCLLGLGGVGGPVMANAIYNNTYQIVQAPGHVMILVEMVHDARIIPIVASKAAAQASFRPAAIRPWLGDSVGWYEGDALVVETRNANPQQHGYLSAHGVLTERFTRWDDGQILYAFTVDDPSLYRQPWRGEMALNASHKAAYEYACHEGNYALPSILSGARAMDAPGR